MKNKQSDQEWQNFLDAIPTNMVAPFGDYQAFLDKEGVTNDDITRWNSKSEQERQKIKDDTQASIMHILVMMTDSQGLSPEDAVRKMHKQMSTYADYPYAQQTISELKRLGFVSEDDYPLPWELFERVGKYSDMMFTNPEKFKDSQSVVKSVTSSNAATRILIRNGII